MTSPPLYMVAALGPHAPGVTTAAALHEPDGDQHLVEVRSSTGLGLVRPVGLDWAALCGLVATYEPLDVDESRRRRLCPECAIRMQRALDQWGARYADIRPAQSSRSE